MREGPEARCAFGCSTVIMMGDTTGKLPIGDRYGGSVAGTLVCRLPGKMCGVSSLNLAMFWSFREVGGDMHTIKICKTSYIGKWKATKGL